MLVTKDKIQDFIPQRPPMIMVDALLSHDGGQSTSSLKVEANNLFCSGGVLREAGLIENMAQTAALHTGWEAMQHYGGQHGFKPPVGMIGAVKKFKLYRLPEVDTELVTGISILTHVFNATIISGKVFMGRELLAECEMQIFIIDNS
jgi:predicted hotdog family 3-hydroxylacyl-ACP dehydratase